MWGGKPLAENTELEVNREDFLTLKALNAIKEEPEAAEKGAETPTKSLDKMNKEELTAYAKAKGIEVDAEMTKAKILEAITAAEKGAE